MEFTFSELLISFLFSIILGFFLGFVYEPFRIIYKLGFNGKTEFFILDIFFMIICGVITFYFLLAYIEGRIRGFVFLGELIGYFVYFFTVRRIFDFLFNPIIKIFKKILKYLLKISRKIMYNIKIKSKKIIKLTENNLLKVKLWKKRKERKTRKS